MSAKAVNAAPMGASCLGGDVGERMAEHEQPEARRRDEAIAHHASHAAGTWMNMILTVWPCW